MKKRGSTISLKKRKGMTLVEILVAIAISIFTMTSSAVFCVSLVQRAQLNFIEISALQLQTIVTEQLRLVESALKKDAKSKTYTDTTSYLYDTNPGVSVQPWADICSTSSTAKYYYVDNNDTDKIIRITALGVTDPVYTVEGNSYTFKVLDPTIEANYGGFSGANTEVLMSVKKTYVTSSDIGEYVSFNTVIGYKLYGKYFYTKPLETRMIKSLICK
jgi:type II secretory pathway pseudopilin PulG